jgi:uncharacterized alkaline shock family protein YloU
MSQYLIATNVLEAIVRGSLHDIDGLRVHGSLPLVRSKPIEVSVDGEDCRVEVHVDARMGERLADLAAIARGQVARALGAMTGLRVTAVDVVFDGVFPAGA